MKVLTLILLLCFVLLRNGFTLIKGKRDRKATSLFIYWGRKGVEIFISLLIPIFLFLGVIETKTTTSLFYLGILLLALL